MIMPTGGFLQHTGPSCCVLDTILGDESLSPAREEETNPIYTVWTCNIWFRAEHEFWLTLGTFKSWGQLGFIVMLFFGIVTRGELSMSGSSSNTGCASTGAAAPTSSEGSTADWPSAVSALDWRTGSPLPASLTGAVLPDCVTVWASGGGMSVHWWNPSEQSVLDNSVSHRKWNEMN